MFIGKIVYRNGFSAVFVLGLISLLVVVDQLLKYMVFSLEVEHYSRLSFAHIALTHFYNDRYLWGFMSFGIAAMLVSFVLLMLVGLLLRRSLFGVGKQEVWGWVLIFSGGLSNVLERMLAGSVRDYLVIHNGIFNLADGYILAGIAIVFYRELVKRKNLKITG